MRTQAATSTWSQHSSHEVPWPGTFGPLRCPSEAHPRSGLQASACKLLPGMGRCEELRGTWAGGEGAGHRGWAPAPMETATLLGVWLALCTPLPICAWRWGGSSSSCRVGSGVTGYPLPQLFSLQLDSDPGLPHTEAIHSSFSLLGPGWPPARPAPAAPAAFQLSWAERGRQGGGEGSRVSPCSPPR